MLISTSRTLTSAWVFSLYALLVSAVVFACSMFTVSIGYAYMTNAVVSAAWGVVSVSLFAAALSVASLLAIFVTAAILDR